MRYDVFLADCPARTTLTLIADTWSVVVVFALGEGPRRYGELQERIGGISKKMLTQTLRKLERNGQAFNQVHFDVWKRSARYAGQPLVVPIAGDPDAKAIASRLVRDAGAEPLDAGGLEHAHDLEAMAAVIIRLLFGGADPLSAFQFMAGTAAASS